MNVYINTAFIGHWPVGTAAVVVASDVEAAAELLEANLCGVGLPQKIDPADMVAISTTEPVAIILCDGDY